METETFEEAVPFAHEPIRPARDGVHGEKIFAYAWKDLMNKEPSNVFADEIVPNQMLMRVLKCIDRAATQRDATVAASIVTWLGCRVGKNFLEEATKLASHGFAHPYLMAWAKHNVRVSWLNHGYRSLELTLAADGKEPQACSLTDYEVAEHVMLWLGTDEGQVFLNKCEADIKRADQAENFKHYLTANCSLNDNQRDIILRMAAEYNPPQLG